MRTIILHCLTNAFENIVLYEQLVRFEDTMTHLIQQHCKPCEGGIAPLTKAQAKEQLAQLAGWALSDDGRRISKRFQFKGFYKTMGFVNAIAWMANQEAHHPDLAVGYDYCEVNYTTHAIKGLSDNDFICAAKVDALVVK